MVTSVPVDVLKREYDLRWDIGSCNADPEYRLINTKNICMSTILNMAFLFEQQSLKWRMRSRTGRVYSAFEGFDNHSSWSQLHLFYMHWWWLWQLKLRRITSKRYGSQTTMWLCPVFGRIHVPLSRCWTNVGPSYIAVWDRSRMVMRAE